MQTKLDKFLNQAPTPPTAKIPISHRELIFYLLQFGHWVKESSLYRTLIHEIHTRQCRGYIISWITWENFQRQLHQLQREGLLQVRGVCWRLRVS